jgi:hypothetical protein
MSIAAIDPNTAIRTAPSSGFSVLVSQAYDAHAHQSGEEERAAQQAIPGQVRGEEAGDLSDGEHEGEIEEELERGHPLFGFVLSLMHLASPVVLRAAYPRSSHDDHHREPSQEHHPWAS